MDLAKLDIRNITGKAVFWIGVMLVYLSTILLDLSSDAIDDRLYFTNFNITVMEADMRSNKVLSLWSNLSMFKNIGAVLGWLLVGFISGTADITGLCEVE